MEQAPKNPRQQVLASLRGSTLSIPNLHILFDHWPQGVNPEVQRLQMDVDKKLENLFSERDRVRHMKSANAALFAASWWPCASFETLRIATYLSIWLFCWDDETDSPEFSSLVSNWGHAQKFRDESVEYIRNCLMKDNTEELTSKLPSHPIIASFRPIGDALCRACTLAQIGTIYNELVFYIEMSGVEQRFQLSEKLPTVEEYQKRRMGSSAVGVCLAITEYCYDMEIPRSIIERNELRPLWDEANRIISIVNDILSVQKEIAQGQVDTLIPLLYFRYGAIDVAVNEAVNLLEASIAAFDKASRELLDCYSSDVASYDTLEKFVNGCKYACTANLNWSVESGRYNLGCRSLRDGITLKL